MKTKQILFLLLISVFLFSCKTENKKTTKQENKTETKKEAQKESSFVEQFDDIKILRYTIPQWNKLSLQQKKLVYYLTQAGLSGRDIMYDQNYRFNLKIRRALEHIYTNFKGDKTTADWKNFETYLKKYGFQTVFTIITLTINLYLNSLKHI